MGVNYALVITTNAGLWAINRGCCSFHITFTFRIQIVGHTKHHINVFGEELMVENADRAIEAAAIACAVEVIDYTAAPIFMNGSKRQS